MNTPASPAEGLDLAPRAARRAPAVLVTGAGGEIGHGLISAFAEAGRQDIIALDVRELDPELRAKCRETFVGDIGDRSLLERLLANYEISEIHHLAALLSTRTEFNPEAAHEVNVNGTLNLLRLAAEQARSHGERVKFLFPSSIAVYGLPDRGTKRDAGAVREHEFCTPITMYGCNKLYCEHLGRYYANHYRQLAKDRVEHAIDFRCLRFPGIISAFTVPSGGTSDFAPEMLHAAAQDKPYASFVRADATIPFMTMPDAIDAMLALAGADSGSLTTCVYNVAAFNPSAGEFAALVREHFPGAAITFEPDEQRQAIVDSWPMDADDTLARKDWGWKPKHDLRTAFEAYLVPNIQARYAGA